MVKYRLWTEDSGVKDNTKDKPEKINHYCQMIEEPTDTDSAPGAESSPANTIGEFVTIIGELSGKEDVVIEGHIEGNLSFPNFSVTVGKHGRIHANIAAREILIEGEVKGDLQASELINIKPSGKVNGNIRALQVVLNQGCQFKGSVDMAETHPHTNHLESRNPKPKLMDNKRHPSGSIGTTKNPVGAQHKTFPIRPKKEEA